MKVAFIFLSMVSSIPCTNINDNDYSYNSYTPPTPETISPDYLSATSSSLIQEPVLNSIGLMGFLKIPEFHLESGNILKSLDVSFKYWGKLNSNKDNVLLVCHGFTGSQHVDQWWGELFGKDKALDYTRFFIISLNTLGSNFGTASPLTFNPHTNRRYGSKFPYVTIRDTVNFHYKVLRFLGINVVRFAVGGSMGGMQVLEWAIMYPEFVQNIIPIAAPAKQSSWAVGFGEIQRISIRNDPNFRDGFYNFDQRPINGLACARMQALMTYRSFRSNRFDSLLQTSTHHHIISPVAKESYLHYNGHKFANNFDANCYISLSHMLDSHNIFRGRNVSDESIKQPCLIIGISSDLLYPIHNQMELHRLFPQSELVIVNSKEGHDGFLIESAKMNDVILKWINSFNY